MTTSRRLPPPTSSDGSETDSAWRPTLFATPTHHDHHPGHPDRVRRFGSKHGGRNLNDEAAAGILPACAPTLWPTPDASMRPHEGNVRLLRKKVLAGEISEEQAEAVLGKSVWQSQGKVPAIDGSLPQATPASRSPMPASGLARMTPGTSGLFLLDSLPDFQPKSGRIGAFGRTFVGTSPWASTVCLLKWKASATPAKRTLFLLQASAPSTSGTESGLLEQGGMWPTPRAGKTTDESEEAWQRRKDRGDVSTPPLSLAVRMWPTPDVPNGGRSFPKEATVRGNSAYMPDGQKVQVKLHHAAGEGAGHRLNPDFVERLMGFPPGWTTLSDSSDETSSTKSR